MLALVIAALLGMSQAYRILPEPVIIGGEDVDPVGKWPFQLSLQIDDPDARHTCGAVLISDEWVLTAAHCTDGRFGFSIMVGAHDIQTQEQGNPTRVEIDEIIEHENYSPFFLWNDIALIHLATPVDVTGDEFVSTVALAPTDSEDYVGFNCYMIGWGTIQVLPDGELVLPDILQEAEVEVMPNDDCNAIYGGSIIDSHICVGEPNESGACFGDSGGPTVCDVSGVWTHVGIASFVVDSFCSTRAPTVYTRTSSFRQWITDNSGV